MLLDLHVHSRYSGDAISQPRNLVKIAAKKGIAFAVTDHDTCAGWKEFGKEAREMQVPLIKGTEIKVTQNGALLGEVLALFLNTPVEKKEWGDVVDSVKAQDGLLAAAHPFNWFRKPYFRGFYSLPKRYNQLDAVETFNSRTLFSRFNRKAKRFAESHGMPQVCGSDAHTPHELGNSLTEVNASSLEAAKKEIRKGRTALHCRKGPLRARLVQAMAKAGLKK